MRRLPSFLASRSHLAPIAPHAISPLALFQFFRPLNACAPPAPFPTLTTQGEGDDEVGSFTISGQYNLKKKTIEFLKQYIGQHSVDYKGTLELHKTHIIFQGLWRIESLSDKFYLKVDLDNRENNGPRRPALGDTVVLLCHATQTALAEKIAKAIEAKGIKAMVPAYNVQVPGRAPGCGVVGSRRGGPLRPCVLIIGLFCVFL